MMRLKSFRRLPLKTKLITNSLVILAAGGLITSLVGSWLISSTIKAQARDTVERDLAIARALYDQKLEIIFHAVQLAASGRTVGESARANNRAALAAYLATMRAREGFDFLGVAAPDGRVIFRMTAGTAGDDVSAVHVIQSALNGTPAYGTEVLTAQFLAREDPQLATRARIRVIPTPRARPARGEVETAGLALVTAAPLREGAGVLYGGILMNGNFSLVDRAWELVFRGGDGSGSLTVFLGDLRISTNVRTEDGTRALGTRASAEVAQAVLDRGETWRGRAFVVRDWYLSAYEPIRDTSGAVAGMLFAGMREDVYTRARNRVVLSFFGVALAGFVLIVIITYYETSRIADPIVRLTAAANSIAAGEFDQELPADAQGEVAQLTEAFNTMLKSLRHMRGDLEEWGRTLEEKVRRRTEELVALQGRVAQSERLASLGMLAAGVAHEINNPLGAIYTLTGLTLEDLPADHPDRENLEEVVRQTVRCRNIVRSLLEFGRRSSGGTGPVDVARLLDSTLSLMGKQAEFLNISVVRHYEDGLPPALTNQSELQQVIMNMLVNAAHAMEERGTLTLVTGRGPEGTVEFSISDTGCGIPADKLGQIFDPFFTTKPSGHGTGLGLSIAYGIVNSYGGTISVVSEVGAGTTVTVRLPVAEPLPE